MYYSYIHTLQQYNGNVFYMIADLCIKAFLYTLLTNCNNYRSKFNAKGAIALQILYSLIVYMQYLFEYTYVLFRILTSTCPSVKT